MLQRDKIYYVVKKPKEGERASFSLLKEVRKPNGSRQYKVVSDERIYSINKAFKDSTKDLTLCDLEMNEVKKSLERADARARGTHVFNEDNRKLLAAYWEQECAHRNIVDPSSSKNDLNRAIETIGSLSLYSASRDDIQRTVSKKYKGNRQRRIVSRLTQLLKFIKRDIKLRKEPKEKRQVRYLSEPEFKKMLSHIEDPLLRALQLVCFSSGCRVGEAFGLKPVDLKNDVLRVDKQLTRDGIIRAPKNRIERQAVILPIETEAFKVWFTCKGKAELRKLKHSAITRNACIKAFPDDKEKWCTIHDLRHSYAIALLSKGVSLSLVAQSLGNSIVVCQEYYTGFQLSSESIDSIKVKLYK